MITIQWAYSLAGLMFAAFALLSALDRSNRKRFGNAIFWGLMALSLLAGSWLGDFANGLLVLGLAGLAGFGLIGRGAPPTTSEGERLTFACLHRIDVHALIARRDIPLPAPDRARALEVELAQQLGIAREAARRGVVGEGDAG